MLRVRSREGSMTGPCVQRSVPGNMNCMNNNIESGGREDKDPVSRDHHNSYRKKLQKGEKPLSTQEKRFMLCSERGDCASVRKMIELYKSRDDFNINCMDPLGRTALSIAIINENPELMEILLENEIKTYDSLLLAIEEEYVDGLEILLEHEERIWKPGTPHSWEAVDPVYSSYTPDITPLILAAHKNNYEIIRILLDQGASLPHPHNIKCSCQPCIKFLSEDSLRYSLSRLNAYRALSSPSLISLTSQDPILTAFKLSTQLRNLAKMEAQFCQEYTSLREQVQSFATSLLDHARSSYELEVILNFNGEQTTWTPGHHQTLERLKLAIKCKQKSFVAHHTVQQLLASIWYEGVPGFRRLSIFRQIFIIFKLGLMYPAYSLMYILAPATRMGEYIRNPFVKFISHSASYILFLGLLAMASQRIEYLLVEIIGTLLEDKELLELVEEWEKKERGSLPSYVEICIIVWQVCLIWKDIKSVYKEGLKEYVMDLWNLADWLTNFCFINWIVLRLTSCYLVSLEIEAGADPYIPREQWHTYDPYLISEGLFGAGMISSYLKLVHILSVNPYMGPLQISLGRMLGDILKFILLFCLVCFAFACGINQLLWYYAVLEKRQCKGEELKYRGAACLVWKRFSNLFETLQSMFWAIFGLVSLADFELTGIKEFTQFWAKLMFGAYSFCNVIVLLNMLIAMMSNSYFKISEKSDKEWKFARTKLWLSYFEAKYTLPPPFNIFPTVKSVKGLINMMKWKSGGSTEKYNGVDNANSRHQDIIRCVVRRYIMAEQKKAEEFGITEDDVSEIRQDINKFRFELVDILSRNNFDIGQVRAGSGYCGGRRAKQMERRILKGFNLSQVEDMVKDVFSKKDKSGAVDIFQVMAEAMNKNRKKNTAPGSQCKEKDIKSEGLKDQYSPATMLAAGKFKNYIKTIKKSENGKIEVRSGLTVPTPMSERGGEGGREKREGEKKKGSEKTEKGESELSADESPPSYFERKGRGSKHERARETKSLPGRSQSYPGKGILAPSLSTRNLNTDLGSPEIKSELIGAAIIPCSITLKVTSELDGPELKVGSGEARTNNLSNNKRTDQGDDSEKSSCKPSSLGSVTRTSKLSALQVEQTGNTGGWI